jgi:hypothetical protein
MFAILDKAKPDRKYKRLKLGGGQAYDLQVIKLVLQPELPLIRHNFLHKPGLKRPNTICTVHI